MHMGGHEMAEALYGTGQAELDAQFSKRRMSDTLYGEGAAGALQGSVL